MNSNRFGKPKNSAGKYTPPTYRKSAGQSNRARDAESGVYRTFFLCELEQDSSFSTGGGEASGPIDMGLARDGENGYVYRGQALAGALLATARTFLDVPKAVTRGIDAKDTVAQRGSLWQFDHARLTNTPPIELRANTAHRQDTRAAHSGGYFDLETLPRGTTWAFLLEVVHPSADPQGGKKAAAQAALALREWMWGRCWLGRRVARGLGWMRLKECQVIELPRTRSAVDAWPKAACKDATARHQYIRQLWEDCGGRSSPLDDYVTDHQSDAGTTTPRRAWARWTLQMEVGEYLAASTTGQEQSYGFDALSILGHRAIPVEYDALGEHLVCPSPARAAIRDNFAPDTVLAMTTPVGEKPEPLVPASGLTGALRHDQARRQRRSGVPTLDPVLGEIIPNGATSSKSDTSSALFGALGDDYTPSRLLLRDSHIAGVWRVALLEKVALDEFRQSVYGSAKYNRLAVLQGAWKFMAVQDIRLDGASADARNTIQHAIAPFQAILAEAKQRRIGFGGGEFRGYGHVPIKASCLEWAIAGQAWQTEPDVEAQAHQADQEDAP